MFRYSIRTYISVTHRIYYSQLISYCHAIYIFIRSYIEHKSMIRIGTNTQTPSQEYHSMQNRMGVS